MLSSPLPSSYGLPFSTSTPSGKPADPFITSVPYSSGEISALGSKHDGGSQEMITSNTRLMSFKDGHDQQIFESQLVIGVPTKDHLFAGYNLRQMNIHLSRCFKDTLDVLELFRANGFTDSISLTKDEYLLLKSMPTSLWHKLKFFQEGLFSSRKDVFQRLVYLNLESLADRFIPYGFPLGQKSPLSKYNNTSIVVGGVYEEIENVWGNDVQAEHRLFLILKRRSMPNGLPGPYGYHPYSGYDQPSLDKLMYIDFNGMPAVGRCYEIARVLWWTNDYKISKEELEIIQGMRESSHDFTKPEDGCLTVRVKT